MKDPPRCNRVGGAMRDADAMRGARGSAWLLAVTTLVVAAVGLVLLV